jgi:hypothetical protein
MTSVSFIRQLYTTITDIINDRTGAHSHSSKMLIAGIGDTDAWGHILLFGLMYFIPTEQNM